MRIRLLDFLACPECGSALSARPRTEIIEEGELACPPCASTWPVHAGVPRFTQAEGRTAAAFGYAWKKFDFLTPHYEAQFLQWIQPATAEIFRDRAVLDAGCGKGRHLRLASRFGARDVVGVDLSDAVDVAHRNTRDLANVHVIQADLYRLPLRPQFDYAYSVGVVHHLPDPAAGVASIARALKPGGSLSLWVYGREGNGWVVKIVDPIRSHLTSRMPHPYLLDASRIIAALLHAVVRGVYLPGRRLPLPYKDYLLHIAPYGFREHFSIVFDHLAAPVAGYHTREEVASWLRAAALAEKSMTWTNRNSWSALAIKA